MRFAPIRTPGRVAFGVLLASSMVVAIPRSAMAQGWLDDLDNAEGPGIAVGDLEFHPGVGVEVGWDSNVFRSDQDLTSSGMLRVTPHLILSTASEDRRGDGDQKGSPPPITFRTGVFATYFEYFEASAPDNLGVGADLDLTINPERPFSLKIDGNYRRRVEPFTEFGAANNNYNRNVGSAGVQFIGSSAGGVFKGSLGYRLNFDVFEGASFSFANNLQHQATGDLAWKFLPQTAIVYDVDYYFTDFYNNGGPPVGASRTTDNSKLRTRIGLNGFISQNIAFTALVGYGAIFFNNDSSFDELDTVVGKAELRWNFTPASQLGVGYERDLFVSYIGGYNRTDRGIVSLRTLLGGRALISVNGSIGGLDFGPLVAPDGTPLGIDDRVDRSDIRVTAGVFGEYRIFDWLGVNASVNYSSTITDFEFARDLGDPAPAIDPAEFQQVQLWAGVRAFY